MGEDIKSLAREITELEALLNELDAESDIERQEAHRLIKRLERRLHRFEAEELGEVLTQG